MHKLTNLILAPVHDIAPQAKSDQHLGGVDLEHAAGNNPSNTRQTSGHHSHALGPH